MIANYYKVPSNKLKRLFILTIVFVISLILGSFYENGDQFFYTKVYNEISNYDIIDGFAFYSLSLSSFEIVHFIVIFLASRYFEKIIFFAFINTLLAYLIINLFDYYKVHFLVTSTFILTNFYIYVLFFAAERLKFGFIFLILASLLNSYKKLRSLTVIISTVAHFQMLIIYASIAAQIFAKRLSRLLTIGKISVWDSLIYSTLGVLVIIFTYEFIIIKIEAYQSDFPPSEYLRIFLFLILTIIYAPNNTKKRYIIILFLPLFLAASQVGGDRVNMLSYIFFLYYAIQYNRGINIGILITSCYFFIKTIFFINNIVIYGTAFP